MKKYGLLRIRITVLITMLLLIVSIITSLVVINNANKSFEKIYVEEASEIYIDSNHTKPITGEIFFEQSTNVDSGEAITGESLLVDTSNSFAKTVIVYMFTITLVASMLTWFITGYSLKKISVLNEELKNIGENNFKIRTENLVGNDEVSELAVSFQEMLLKLEKSFIAQKSFVSGAAHELKTPLAIMKSGLQVLNIGQSSTIEEYKENAKVMEKSTDRLISLVSDLMSLTTNSNIEKNEIVYIEDIINTSIKNLDDKIKEKNLLLIAKLEPIIIKGNESLLNSAIFNIIENAVKYNVINGQVSILLYKSNNIAIIKVKDTGIGIKENDLERIFETFYRSEKSRSREYGGAGLGLAISKNIIDLHNGTIDVESNGIETEFTITFKIDI